MPYTIKDVAQKANVSIATVSRILNDQTGYSKKTKEKVLKVIEQLGYQPNGVARGLITKRTHTIGVLFPHLSGSLVTELLRGIEKSASAHGSSVFVCHTESDSEKTMKYLKLLNEKRVDGIIFTSGILLDEYYEYIKKINVPMVLLATQSEKYPFPFVKVNDHDAAYSATQYLINKGHTRIGMISGNADDLIAGKPRIDGFTKALKDNNIPVKNNRIVVTKGFGFSEGVAGLKSLLTIDPEITAIFAASDEIAIGAISSAYHLGIKVPDELSIIGYDNLSFAEMSIPPLTTVAQPFVEMGETAGNILFKMLDTDELVDSQIVLHKIIERMSVKEEE